MELDTYVSDAVSSSPIARPGAAMETPAGAGVDTAHSPWLGQHKTTTLIIVLLAASAVTASSRKIRGVSSD